MRLVDADAYKAEGRELYREAGWDLREVHYSQLDTECNIDMMPTIEAEPIKHGRWIKDDIKLGDDYSTVLMCSECDKINWGMVKWDYCPNCGAKMIDGEVEE